MSSPNEELNWLIRDSSLTIRGPISQVEIVAMVKKGLLKGKIEISKCNAYWFSIDEKAEVAKFLPELDPSGGVDSAPDSTQMTETITHAGMFDAEHETGVEITQFTNMPTRADLLKANKEAEKAEAQAAAAQETAKRPPATAAPSNALGGPSPASALISSNKKNVPDVRREQKQENAPPVPKKTADDMQWLDPAVAAEFGDLESAESLSMENDLTHDPTQQTAVTERAISNELLLRATVKADTLPSEMKDSGTARPLPISSIIKSKPTIQLPTSPVTPNYVNVSVAASEMSAKIIQVEDETESASRSSIIFTVLGVIFALGLMGYSTYYFVAKNRLSKFQAIGKLNVSIAPLDGLRKSLFLFDLDQAEKFIQKLNGDTTPETDLMRAIYKKELLYNAEGAIADLNTAKVKASNSPIKAEIENLLGVYTFEIDPNSSLATLKNLAEGRNSKDIYRYNYALALGRSRKYQESLAAIGNIPLKSLDSALSENMKVLSGWMKYLLSEGADSTVFADFEEVLEENPFSGTARIGLAIAKLHSTGMKEADREFKTFIESVPDLDEPSQVPYFRQMRSLQLYDFARDEIRSLNVPGGNVGQKPSAIIMAVDAIISCIQNRTGEAKKIIESALVSSPGDPFVLKALAYQRWKEGKYEEVLETFKESSKDRNSFSTLLLISKSLMKAGRASQAEPYVKQILNLAPERSEGLTLKGDILVLTGNIDAAMNYYKSALTKNPADLHALKGLSQIEETWPKYFKRISHYFPN